MGTVFLEGLYIPFRCVLCWIEPDCCGISAACDAAGVRQLGVRLTNVVPVGVRAYITECRNCLAAALMHLPPCRRGANPMPGGGFGWAIPVGGDAARSSSRTTSTGPLDKVCLWWDSSHTAFPLHLWLLPAALPLQPCAGAIIPLGFCAGALGGS
jgi:hypothetical protein